MKKFAIVTGASRGFGSAISHKLLAEGYSLISISRIENSELRTAAAEHGTEYIHFPCNLADGAGVEHTFSKVLDEVNKDDSEEILMIHNAGTVAPIHTVGNLQHQAAAESTQINFISPMIMTNMLFQLADKKLKIANITSGAAERPIEGWSVYCSTKAALNMFTKTAALEQKTAGTSHTIFAFNPGIMDTDMQGEIRSSTQDQFSDIAKFQDYKKEGLLRAPEIVAETFVALLLNPDTESGEIYHIHDFVN
jgi:benzil reductase ((S)-benzoin forming)